MKWLSTGGSSAQAESGKMNDEARILIRAGDVEIDLSGAQTSVDESASLKSEKTIHGQSHSQELEMHVKEQ